MTVATEAEAFLAGVEPEVAQLAHDWHTARCRVERLVAAVAAAPSGSLHPTERALVDQLTAGLDHAAALIAEARR